MRNAAKRNLDIFVGPSEMHARTRAFDWSSSPLGPVELWPQSLTSVVKMLLASRYPMVLTWGQHFIQFYNDAYSKLIGDKHPLALGQDIRITLAEGWETLGPMIKDVMANGVANWNPALLLALQRSGYLEEAYFDVSHAPVEDDNGQIVGMLGVCTEVTQQVLGDRRLRLLRDLAVKVGEARSISATCNDISACITEHHHDVPFALLYLREGEYLSRCEIVGLEPNDDLAPQTIELGTDADYVWPFTQVIQGESIVIENVERHTEIQGGPWNQPVSTALALPISGAGQSLTRGVLIVGVNPNRALDESYRSFYDLLVGQVAAALRNARVAEEERERIEALAQLDRAKTEFFSNVSHEFRTPLTLMLGPLEELLSENSARLHAEDREQIQVAHRNALRLLKLVNTLLDFSRTEAERAEAEFVPVDLASLTTDLASLFRSAIEKAGLELVVECQPIPQPVLVDRDMWEKIILNLLSNAFKFTQQGRITVRQYRVDDCIELSVSDTGCGIPQQELGNVFKRFHRVAGTQGRSHEGTGIGLALVQELVRLHGGNVAVTSVEGEGTTFTITIPIVTERTGDNKPRSESSRTTVRAEAFVEEALRWLPQVNEQQASSEGLVLTNTPTTELHNDNLLLEDGSTRPRILLADDNADMREYVRRILSVRYDVVAVANGEAALAAVREQLPDVVLSDVMMPRIDGFNLLTQLRSDPRTQTIPVILLSARAGEEARLAGLENGADDYLIKPFAANELLARVTTHLKLVRMRQAAAEELARRTSAEATIRARDEFLSLAAHELKTPLTSIRGYIDLFTRRLMRDGNLAARDQQTLKVITQQVDRLGSLVSVLLDLSRLEMGQFVLEQRHLDMIPVIRRVVDTAQGASKQHNLELQLPDEQLMVWGDELRLEQVLHNLVSNAIKYSPAGGTVTLGAQRQHDQICIFVRDQGIGIPESGRERIFQRFYRAGNVNDGYFSGLGIGLYVVKQIVVQHGGDVDVISQEGQGSTFIVYLPVSSPQSSHANDPSTRNDLVGSN